MAIKTTQTSLITTTEYCCSYKNGGKKTKSENVLLCSQETQSCITQS